MEKISCYSIGAVEEELAKHKGKVPNHLLVHFNNLSIPELRLLLNHNNSDHDIEVFGLPLPLIDIEIGGVIVCPKAHSVRVGCQEIQFTSKEDSIFWLLLQSPCELVRYEKIYSNVWCEFEEFSEKNLLQVHISNIRKKLSGTRLKDALFCKNNVGYILNLEKI